MQSGREGGREKAGGKGRKENAQFKQSTAFARLQSYAAAKENVVERGRERGIVKVVGGSVGRSVGERGVRNEDIIPGWKYVMRGEERRRGPRLGEREGQDEKQH